MSASDDITHASDSVAAPNDASSPSTARSAAPTPAPVPRWLAALVLVLLLAVVLVAGFVIRSLTTRDQRPSSPQEIEIATWTQRVAANPNDPRARLGLGYAYQSDGRYDKALDQYAIVLKTNPRDTAALYNRANIYFRLGIEDRAEKSMWEVLDVDPSHVLAAKALGDYYASKEHYKSLIEAVKPAADAHPELADLQYLLGLAFEKRGDPATAASYYQRAVKYSPDLTAAQEGLKRVGAGK